MSTISVAVERKDDEHSVIKVYVNGMAPVVVAGRARYQRLRLTVGVIPTKDWDPRSGRPTMAFNRRDGGALQREIDLKVLNIGRAYHEAPVKTPVAVRDRYMELIGRKRREETRSTMLVDVVNGWVGKLDKSPDTVRTYRAFGEKIAAYEQRTGTRLDMAQTRTEDLEAFLAWCSTRYRLGPNTLASAQKLLNKALNELRAANTPVCGPIKRYAFRAPDRQILEWEDLVRVTAYIPKNRTEASAQTILVGLCLTGARISDTYRLFDSIAKRSGVLCGEFVCHKNESRFPVRVSPIVFEPVRDLIERNGLPGKVSEKHIRQMVSRLLLSVGVEKDIEVHSLRRSFVSLFLGLGVIPDHLLARCFTGHAIAGGARSIFHGYNRATMAQAHRTVIQLLRLVPAEQTGGLTLLSQEVCSY